MTYTLIGYASDGSRTCRGCEVDRWGSTFVHEPALTRERLVERVAALMALEGKDSFDELLWFPDTEDEDGEYLGQDLSIRDEAAALVPALRRATQEAFKQKADAEAARRQRAQDDRERMELARLQAKFGGQS